MEYLLTLNWKIGFTCEAASREDAIDKAKAAHPQHSADFIGDSDFSTSCIVRCAGCEKPLFEDSQYSMDLESGENFCTECTPAEYDKYLEEEHK